MSLSVARASTMEKTGPSPVVWYRPWRRLSLYARVVIVNTTVLVVAVVVLVVSPATVSFPVAAEQGVVLGLGVCAMVVFNAVLLRMNFRGLNSVLRRMRTLDLLEPPERLHELGGRDARTLIAGFNGMVDRLESERRSSTRRAVHALESERRRIGLELHDEIGQRLTGTLLQLGSLAGEVPQPVRAAVIAIQEEQRNTLDEVGALAWQLRPALLDDLGLVRALEAVAGNLREHAASDLSVSLPRRLDGLSPEIELVLYRIAQEAMTNAVRHSRATSIQLALRAGEDQLTLEVVDNGLGMEDDELGGPGIRGMRERALVAGGRLAITAGPQGGVLVRLVVPTEAR